MDLGLKSKVAIITGGATGIGKATALKLLQEGARVAICGRRGDVVAQAAAELKSAGGAVLAVAADVSKAADIERFIGAAADHFGRIDILVNNAGNGKRGKFLQLDDAEWSADLDLKLYAAIRSTRLAVPHMRKQGGGRIINVSSIGGRQPATESMPASLSRAAGLALVKGLSKEFAPDNILINVVSLGKIKTVQQQHWLRPGAGTDEQQYANAAKVMGIPMGRLGEADEVANVIAFLASSAASYVTGTCINIDGGLCAVL